MVIGICYNEWFKNGKNISCGMFYYVVFKVIGVFVIFY